MNTRCFSLFSGMFHLVKVSNWRGVVYHDEVNSLGILRDVRMNVSCVSIYGQVQISEGKQ